MREKRTRPAVPFLTSDGTPRSRSDASTDTSGAPAASSPGASAVDSAAELQKRRTLIAELALFRDMAAETVEQMPLGFVALDHQMCATYANPVALRLTGASLDALVGRRPWDLFPEIVGTQHQTVRASAPITIEYEEHFASGDRWAAVLACPTTTGISIFLRDISGQKRAEETVRSSMTLLHGSLDAMRDACMLCSAERDAQGAIVSFRVDFANVVAGTYLGGPPDKLMGAPIPEWKINPRDMPFIDACRRVVETGDPWAVDALAYAIAGPEGTSTPGALSLQVARFSDGFFATWRDVTENERLASERERLAAIVDQVADGIVAVDAELRVTYANAAFAGHAGRTLSELVGRGMLEVVDGTLDAPTIAKLAEVTRSGQPWLGEAERRLADGTVGPVQIRATPRRAADGTLEGYVFVSRDVSELRRGEADLRASLEKYRTLFEESLDGLFVTSPAGRILDINRKGIAMFGYDTKEEALRLDLEQDIYVRPPDRARILGMVRDRGSAEYEVDVKRKNGEQMTTHCSLTAVLDEHGAISSYRGIIRDITERKRAEAERALLAAAVEQAADFVIVVGREGIVQAVNPAFERLSGYPPGEVLGRSVASVLRSGVDPPEVYAALDEALRRGDAWNGRLAERRADGSLLDVDLSVSPIRDAAGDLIGSVEIGRDHTHERELEAEREREAEIRVALAESLAAIPLGATLEQAAQAICDALVTLPFVDVATIQIFLGGDDVEILAQSAPPGYPAMAGTHLPPARAAIVRERSAGGPWARYAESDPADGGLRASAVRSGLKALAYGPIAHDGQVRGALVLGTFDERLARTVVEQMPGLVSFSATSSALLGGRMQARREERDLRHVLAAILAARAFQPVFQPIVDLATGETMGYEALTRFDSGQRPDLCFADAWSVGLGAEFEIATLEAAVAAGKHLPTGVWLDLNVSPRLLADPERLRPVLWQAGRPIVLEVTEHDVIDDYDFVRGAFHALGNDVRLAVDDAGVGIANFGHIIELRPDFVKLDISLVRRVNAHLGRQAMVVGMRHFSLTVGCRLIAEGVETEEEAATLRALGVEFGQGYLFGHPEPVDVWAAALPQDPRPSDGPAGPREEDRHA